MMDTQEQYWNPMVPELTVSDFARSLSFYVDMLGFTVLIRRDNPDFAYLCSGEAQLMLEAYHSGSWDTGELSYPLGRGVNFQIEVDDITPLFTRLRENNIQLYREPNDNFYSTEDRRFCQREFLVQDPDGYLLRFSQYIDSSPQD